MKRFLIVLGIVVAIAAVGVGALAATYTPTVPLGAKVGSVDLGGLTASEVRTKLSEWWEKERVEKIALTLEGSGDSYEAEISKLGVSFDAAGTASGVPVDGFLDHYRRLITSERSTYRGEPKLSVADADVSELAKFVEARIPDRQPARVVYRDGEMERKPEVSGFTLDRQALGLAVLEARKQGGIGKIPLVVAPKRVPDEALNTITDIVSEFTTHFSEGKATRSHNIRTAAGKIDGVVLAPGEQFSFNKTVGRRTIQSGFQVAGVYKDGKHDVDVGGGICQVSTTLYNAALFANLKIGRRTNHSMPVPYVPLGRDATVDYGSADLVFKNVYDQPIAISSTVGRGVITFRILGVKDPTLSVRIESGGASSWQVGEKEQPDPSLPAGKTKVIEKGCMGHSISTTRVVYRNGVEEKREPLGMSIYRGAKRIIAVGTAGAKAPETTEPPITPASAQTGG